MSTLDQTLETEWAVVELSEDDLKELRQRHERYLIGVRWFRSLYSGQCSHCETYFKSGTLICPDGMNTYVAYCCAPDLPVEVL